MDNFIGNLKEMLGFEPGYYWRLCWSIGAPVFLLGTIISCFVTYEPLKYQDFVYPQTANILGILFSLSSVSAILIVGLYKLWIAEGDTFTEKVKIVLIPYRRDFANSNRIIGSMSNSAVNL
uniref:Uncharacterized protein n=1 Tax=Setaria digitata TaxID=48799 RepID=A0A915PYU2_9BILA